MGAIEDVRKLLQDVVAPELKAVHARLLAIDKKVDALDVKLEGKIDLTTKILSAQMQTLQATLSAEIARLDRSIELERRIEKLESERAPTNSRPLSARRLGLHRP